MGLETLRIGKQYYRESIRVKTLVEHKLGLLRPLEEFEKSLGSKSSLSIAVTDSQLDPTKVLSGSQKDIDQFGKTIIRPNTIVGHTARIFWAMIVIEAICTFFAFGQAIQLANPI